MALSLMPVSCRSAVKPPSTAHQPSITVRGRGRIGMNEPVATGQPKWFICRGENVVVLTTLVDLTRQLSNFRDELRRLVDTHLQA